MLYNKKKKRKALHLLSFATLDKAREARLHHKGMLKKIKNQNYH